MSDATRSARSSNDRAQLDAMRARAWGHIIFNGALALLFAFMFLRAGELPSSMWEPMGAGTFPRLVLALLVIFNFMIIVKELPHLKRTSALASGAVRNWLRQHRLAFGVLLLFGLLTAAVPVVGFRWASFPFLVACQYLLGARSGKALLIAALIALVMSFGLDILFRHVLTISLPRGLWG
ncbi:tripartite tricarboxylate transporter TctB family protein [Billgrantia diversa]|uniref:tripartite tricarboxylate transporter TctB family protein n=1 Tax=Halomonas sp. MCCC 1A13316 TaxID=2733487 RepID=UPI0018A529B0|nr:tripartite tricarboxylate transporter TctB family protein [Halomonas sp. MCCC 1A13316]QOR38012.1 tripartite tricarboxylate transporter TctB family protein [Halomonas sp. MCCC 1A13316]